MLNDLLSTLRDMRHMMATQHGMANYSVCPQTEEKSVQSEQCEMPEQELPTQEEGATVNTSPSPEVSFFFFSIFHSNSGVNRPPCSRSLKPCQSYSCV